MERFHPVEEGSSSVSFFDGKQHEFLYDSQSNSMLEVAPFMWESSETIDGEHSSPQNPSSTGIVGEDHTLSGDNGITDDGWPESLDSLSFAVFPDMALQSDETNSKPQGSSVQGGETSRKSTSRQSSMQKFGEIVKSRTKEVAKSRLGSSGQRSFAPLEARNLFLPRGSAFERIGELEQRLEVASRDIPDGGERFVHQEEQRDGSLCHSFVEADHDDEIPILSKKARRTAGEVVSSTKVAKELFARKEPVSPVGTVGTGVTRSTSGGSSEAMYPGQTLGESSVRRLPDRPSGRTPVTRKEKVLAQRAMEKPPTRSSHAVWSLNTDAPRSRQPVATANKGKQAEKVKKTTAKRNFLDGLRRRRSVNKNPVKPQEDKSKTIKSEEKNGDEVGLQGDSLVTILGIAGAESNNSHFKPSEKVRSRSFGDVFRKQERNTGTVIPESRPSEGSMGSSTVVMGNTRSRSSDGQTSRQRSGVTVRSRSSTQKRLMENSSVRERSFQSQNSNQPSIGTVQSDPDMSSKGISKKANWSGGLFSKRTKSAIKQESKDKSKDTPVGTARARSDESQVSRQRSIFSVRSKSSEAAAVTAPAKERSFQSQNSSSIYSFRSTNEEGTRNEQQQQQQRRKGSWRNKFRPLEAVFNRGRKRSDGPATTCSFENNSESSSIWKMVSEEESLQTKRSARSLKQQQEDDEPGILESFISSLFDYALDDDWDSESSSDYSSDNGASFSSTSESQGRLSRIFRGNESKSQGSDSILSVSDMVTDALRKSSSWIYGE